MANPRLNIHVADILRAKQLLEEKLEREVQLALAEFELRTGFTPSAIDVSLSKTVLVDHEFPDYQVDNVRAEIRIT